MIVALLSALAFGIVLISVVTHGGRIEVDSRVATFVASHRLDWLVAIMRVVTWLGSSVVIIPFDLIIGGYFLVRRRTLQPLILMTAALAGAGGLYGIVKPVVGRARPPAFLQVGPPDTSWSFPSGHATQSISFYGMLAVVLILWYAPNRRRLFALAAALVTLVVGSSRLYLGVHWLTDVLGGYALGLAWLAVLMVAFSLLEDRNPRRASVRPTG